MKSDWLLCPRSKGAKENAEKGGDGFLQVRVK